MAFKHVLRAALVGSLSLWLTQCGDPGPGTETSGSPDNAGQPCDGAEDCYPDVNHADLRGDVVCTTKVEGGYCTHTCEEDVDCCAIPGECVSEVRQVCSPFENDSTKRCFLSCEAADIGDYDDPDQYCNDFWATGWTCASSGGGSENRKICKP